MRNKCIRNDIEGAKKVYLTKKSEMAFWVKCEEFTQKAGKRTIEIIVKLWCKVLKSRLSKASFF